MKNRNLKLSTATKFLLGYHGELSDRLYFPLRDLEGNFVAQQGRALFDYATKGLPKYHHSSYNKGDYFYGMYEMLDLIVKLNYVIIVEGPFDVLAAWEQEIPAVSTFGATFSPKQALLASLFTDRIVSGYDSDKAGQLGWKQCKDFLEPYNVQTFDLELKKDLSDMYKDGEKLNVRL